jgi:hypothetical protein
VERGGQTRNPNALDRDSRLCAQLPSAPALVFRYSQFMELIFEIRDAEEGGFYARVGPKYFHRR